MTEDSGTFKTLQADLCLICRFVIRKTTVASLHHGTKIRPRPRSPESPAPFFTEQRGIVAVCSNQPDSPPVLSFDPPRGERGKQYRHRVQMAHGPWPLRRRGGNSQSLDASRLSLPVC